MGYLAYDLAAHLLALLAVPFLPLLWWSRHGEGLSERLGKPNPGALRLHRPIWIHAASVGEVLSAQPLVVTLRRHYPRLPILISTTSLTGRATARARLQPDAAMLLPIDLRWILRRVLRALRPSCLLIVETELWPGLLRAASEHGVPVALVSGRLQEGSARRYASIRWFMRTMLEPVSLFAMQTEADAERIRAIGADPRRVHVVGSLKHARSKNAGALDPARFAGLLAGRPLLLAASTHAGEEDLVLDALESLRAAHPELVLALAPRRPERFEEVAERLRQRGIPFERRTQVSGVLAAATRVLLVDTLGELVGFFPLCRAAFVGGTFTDVGGHNVAEPALFGRPVAFGPRTENVAKVADTLLQEGGGVRVGDAQELSTHWRHVLDNPDEALAMGARGHDVVREGAEVAEKTFDLLAPILDEVIR